MRYAIDILIATLCATPIFVLVACTWWFFHEQTPEPETTQRAMIHIEQQMKTVRPFILRSDIEKAYDYLHDHPVMLVRIKNNTVKIKIHTQSLKHITYYIALEENLKKYAKHLKDNLFLWVIADEATSIQLPPELKHVPIFVFALDKKATYTFTPLLNVDSFTLKKWPRLFDSISRNIVPYAKQEPVLFWRGKSSDITYGDSDESPRSFIVNLSNKNPKLINARFTKVFSKDPAANEKLRERYKECSNVGEIDHLRYRYQIVLDGVTATFPGFLWRLASGCTTLKQDSSHHQWFYDWLEPYKHYIPIKSDLSDLMNYLDKAPNDHDVAKNARELIEAELTPAKVLGYFTTILNKLSERVKETAPDQT